MIEAPRRQEAFENSKRPPGRPRKVEIEPEVIPVKVWGADKRDGKVLVECKFGYFPEDPDHPKNPRVNEPQKVPRGEQIWLPRDEAKRVVARGIAVAVVE